MTEEPTRAYLNSLAHRLAADGCAPHWVDWGGVPVLVGRREEFRLRWMATKLHLFTVAAAVPEITVPVVAAFTTQVERYCKSVKGGLPVGLQNGLGTFPVLVSERVDPAAVAWARQQQHTDFACLARPVVVDTARRMTAYYGGRPLIGYAYAAYMVRKGDLYFPGEPFPQA
ncbi:levansucrase [Streptomyces sp. NPDC058001]|uniref:levansucrase n=1 Tax=Streptomyces sp. NPDC058001 TaxID=3346300 RepID=UPI0036E9537F